MSKSRVKIAVFEGAGDFGTKFQVKGDVSQQTFFVTLN